MLLPRLVAISSLDAFWSGGPLDAGFDFRVVVCETLVPLMTLIVPSFFRHALRLQLKMYSFLSWPGNLSGRSPFNCSNRVIMLLQILHLASSAERGSVSSSHV